MSRWPDASLAATNARRVPLCSLPQRSSCRSGRRGLRPVSVRPPRLIHQSAAHLLSRAILGLSSSGSSIRAIWMPNPMYKRLPQRGHEEVFLPYSQALPVTESRLLSSMHSSAARTGVPYSSMVTDCLNAFQMQAHRCNGIKPQTTRADRLVSHASHHAERRCAMGAGLWAWHRRGSSRCSDSCVATPPVRTCAMAAHGRRSASLLGSRDNCIARCIRLTRDDPRGQSQAGCALVAANRFRIGVHR